MSDATKKWLNEDEQELCAVLICRSDAESARTLDLVARLCSRLDAQQAEADETQQTFDMMWDADQRAIKAWQAETGEDMVWPDRKVLTRWLLDKIDAQQEVIGKLPKTADGVPVTPGMKVYCNRKPGDDTIAEFVVCDYSTWTTDVWGVPNQPRVSPSGGDNPIGGWPARSCYSTPEAAASARKEQP